MMRAYWLIRDMCCVALLIAWPLTVGAAAAVAHASDRAPLLGWSSWSFVRRGPTESGIEAQALALHRSGLQDLGYRYVNLDDFWYRCPSGAGPDVDDYGRWVVDATRFPAREGVNGIEVVADYVHHLGLKFGIYVTPGVSALAVSEKSRIKGTPYTVDQIVKPDVHEANYNCGGMDGIDFRKPGAQQYIDSWAEMFASWGVDFIKLDGIANSNVADIMAWSHAIRRSGRSMSLDVTDGIFTMAIAPTLMDYATQWEMLPDVECYACERGSDSYPLTSWANVAARFQWVSQLQPYSRPGHFNDYDSIEIGNGDADGLTPDERKSQISLWAMAAAPLILGSDLTHLDARDLGYLENAAVLSVDQDSIAAKMVANYHDDGPRVFAKTEADGDVIVGLFNLADKPQRVAVLSDVVGLSGARGRYIAKNLWTGASHTIVFPFISAVVPAHGVVLYRVAMQK